MKRLIQADNLLIATLWQSQLAAAGIACELRNRFLGGAVGELPADQVLPELWVRHLADFEQARALLDELRHPKRSPSWLCGACGEQSEGQFSQCWQCQQVRHIES